MIDEMLNPDTKAYGAERLEITLMSFITDCFNAILETRLHLPLTILPILTKWHTVVAKRNPNITSIMIISQHGLTAANIQGRFQ